MSLFETHHYTAYLKEELLERTRKNPSYSLRAMARDLGVAPSLLSEVLKGKRHFSGDVALKVAERLKLSSKGREYFLALVSHARSKKPQAKQLALERLESLHPDRILKTDLGLDQFRAISEWYHFPILRLIEEATLSKTEFVPLDVAKRLDIHLVEVDQAIGRLERLGRIRKAEPKEGVPSYRKIEQEVSIFSQVPSEALRKFHTQWLEKTLRALHEQTQAERYTSTETLILSENQLQEAERIFDEALDRVTALSQTRDRGGEVHHIGIHRIRVTHPRKKGKSP